MHCGLKGDRLRKVRFKLFWIREISSNFSECSVRWEMDGFLAELAISWSGRISTEIL